jgi:hypothetical protein
MTRIAIMLVKGLSLGQIGNVSAILMGQGALLAPAIYGDALADRDGNAHAGIRYSTVILEANGSIQLSNFAQSIRQNSPNLTCILFSKAGQALNNAFDQYCDTVRSKYAEELQPVGCIVVGDDVLVRTATRKFSLLH